MRSSLLATSRWLRLVCGFIVSGGLLALVGCGGQTYDEQMTYGARTDLLVAPADVPWGDVAPHKFNRPGLMPLETISLPQTERTPDADRLAKLLEDGKKILDPSKLPAADRDEYAKNLTEMFGTPAKPKVSGFEPAALKVVDEALTGDVVIKTLKLDEKTLAAGSASYRSHCLHCHGLTGNGHGPTGPWVNPPPRDYRQGVFKFTSSNLDQGLRKPRREDLLHVLNHGIDGTSMPSFNILSDEDKEQLASYVIHLSIRGEVEYQTMLFQLRQITESKGADLAGKARFETPLREDLKNPTMKQALEDNLAMVASRWVNNQKPEAAIKPENYPYGNADEEFLTSAARGGRLFVGSCISCHQNYGRESNLVYDAWGTIVRGRNVYDGIYRGGRRSVDLYYRIHSGINGAGMTSYKDLKEKTTPEDIQKMGMTPEEFAKTDPIWDIVNFLRAVSYRDLREKLRGEPFKLNLPD